MKKTQNRLAALLVAYWSIALTVGAGIVSAVWWVGDVSAHMKTVDEDHRSIESVAISVAHIEGMVEQIHRRVVPPDQAADGGPVIPERGALP